VRSFDSRRLRQYLARYCAPDMVIAAAGSVDHKMIVEEVQHRFASFSGPEGPLPDQHDVLRRRASSSATSKVHVAFALKACRSAIPRSTACRFSPTYSAAECRALFQEVREIRGLCYPSTRSTPLRRHRHARGLCRHGCVRPPGRCASWSTRSATRPRPERDRDQPLKAQMKAGLLMALESSGARARSSPADDDLAGRSRSRDRRQDRGGHGRRRGRRARA
jgi:hypothetical protein